MFYLLFTMAQAIGFILMGNDLWFNKLKSKWLAGFAGASYFMGGLYLAHACDITDQLMGY